MNDEQAVQTMQALGANWPTLNNLDELGLELWYRNALRHTPWQGSDTKPGALEVVDRLVATMTFQPKPADWLRVHGEISTEYRRRTEHVLALNEPQLSPEERKANLAKVRAVLDSIPKRDTL